ncbi:phage tail assembly chaperone [Myxococcus stipitatus DSM 14675]|uniref:Phage tail assembly chaperone n=1 Tax=Myxococcus stipitatus (strain DSM 14675 / JCM 12634 / Mx s8) TaxID=1278073 RepID=L7UAF6_MYXSD|nr:phage tail assembly chaperone [Myxococcus stipitatus]AGC44582.1 phage tail assembly chaperone [Myxococcus stipitatus DSM 14675]
MSAPVMHRKPLGTRRALHKRVTLDGAEFDICRPTLGEKMDVLSASRAAGEMGDNRQPVDEAAGMMMIARIAACCLYFPGTATRVFTAEDVPAVKNEPWLEEVQGELALAFAGPTLETAKGNSETTPS